MDVLPRSLAQGPAPQAPAAEPGFVDLAASRLEPGARWRLATDWADYAEVIRSVLDDHPGLIATTIRMGAALGGAAADPLRAAGLAAGRAVHDLSYRRAG